MNCLLSIACLLVVASSVSADGLGLGAEGLVYAPGHASVDYYAYPRYAFEYSVKDPHTGDNKAQWEKRDGDVVKGAYSLVEPDGSLRIVEYWADDKSGFNANVKRIGPNLHPTVVAAPIYKAPIPVLGHGPVVAPISIGPVAKYGGLANAPLISGPIHGGAISTATLIKNDIPIVKQVIPELPVIAPVHGPVLEKIVPGPILPVGPALPYKVQRPVVEEIIYKPAPLPIYKSLPVPSLPIYKNPLPLGPVGPWGGLRAPLVYSNDLIGKDLGPIGLGLGGKGLGPIGGYGPDLIGKGPIGPIVGYGPELIGKGPIGPIGGYGPELIGKGPIGPIGGYGPNLIGKGPIGPVGGYAYDLIGKGPIGPIGNEWNGPLDYPLLKH